MCIVNKYIITSLPLFIRVYMYVNKLESKCQSKTFVNVHLTNCERMG